MGSNRVIGNFYWTLINSSVQPSVFQDENKEQWPKSKKTFELGAAIALWIRLGLPSYGPRFKSQAHHLRF